MERFGCCSSINRLLLCGIRLASGAVGLFTREMPNGKPVRVS